MDRESYDIKEFRNLEGALSYAASLPPRGVLIQALGTYRVPQDYEAITVGWATLCQWAMPSIFAGRTEFSRQFIQQMQDTGARVFTVIVRYAVVARKS